MKIHKYNLARIAVLAVVYFVAGKLGLMLAFVNPSATAVWPCTGIALAALLIFGYEVWPGILLGALAVNLATAGSLAVCLGIATGNTLEALVGAYLVNRFAGGRWAMQSTRNVLKFVVLAGGASAVISATIGFICLALGGAASWHWHSFAAIWSTWWLGDAVGDVVIAPLVLLWVTRPRLHWRQAQFLEAEALLAALVVSGLVIFNRLFGSLRHLPLEFFCLPLLLWTAVRLGQRAASSAIVVLAGVAIVGTYRGFGPFAVGSPNQSLLLLQSFIGVSSVMTMAVAALFAERRHTEEEARVLAVSDPLTGLGNYRKLIDALEAEIKRSDRTGRSFAFLLMDLDGLKKINDAYGHLTGSRALCRLADVLRMNCRSFDTAARYGGDEFALILPEADEEVARQVSRRVRERLARDGQFPSISVSIGAAVWPQDGNTQEALIHAADLALYAMKRRVHDADSQLSAGRALAAGGVRS